MTSLVFEGLQKLSLFASLVILLVVTIFIAGTSVKLVCYFILVCCNIRDSISKLLSTLARFQSCADSKVLTLVLENRYNPLTVCLGQFDWPIGHESTLSPILLNCLSLAHLNSISGLSF